MKRKLLPVLGILLIAGLLTLILQNHTRQLISPLLFMLWIGRLLLESIPQAVIWGIFIALALLIAGRSLLGRRAIQRSVRPTIAASPGRIQNWARLIEQAEQDAYYQWQLAQSLRELIMAVLAHHERLSPKEIRERLADNTLDLPPELQAYLQASMTSFSHLLGPKPRFRSRAQSTPLELDPEQITMFLEEKLDYQLD